MKKKLSYKNQDKISHLSKISYLIKIFDIILPNLNPRPEDKKMVKNNQNRSQIKLNYQTVTIGYNQNSDQPAHHPPCLHFRSSHYLTSRVSK